MPTIRPLCADGWFLGAHSGRWPPLPASSAHTVATAAVEALRAHRRVQAAERLRAGEAWVDQGYVFVNYYARPFEPNFVSKEFKEVAAEAGLTLNFHQLRHGAATLMIAKGIPLKLIRETLGHSTIVITADTYGHVAPEVQRLAAVAMDEVLTATTGGARAPPQVTPSAPPPSA